MGPTLIATTGWCVDAPASRAWPLLARADAWPSWWSSVATVSMVPPAPRRAATRPMSGRALLGFPLRLDLSLLALEPRGLLEWQFRGDVEARSTWVLDAGPAGDTGITCRWELQLPSQGRGPAGLLADWLLERRLFALMTVLAQDSACRLGGRMTTLRQWRGRARRGAPPDR